MTAVKKVAIAGSGVAALATAIQLAKAGVEVDVFEAKPEPSTLGSGISLQGNALRVFDALGAWDDMRAAGYPFEGLNLRAPGPGAPVVAQMPDVKSGGPDYPGADGDAAARARPDPPRARAEGRRQRPLRREGDLAGAGRRPRRGVRQRRVGRCLRPARRRGRPELDRARHHRHRDQAAADGHGHLARVRLASRPRSSAPSSTTAGRCTSPATRRRARTRCTRSSSRRRRTGSASPDDEATQIMLDESRAYDGPWNSIRADLESRRAGELHLVHPAHRPGAVEPGARRRHRRCRAQLPADDRAGRGAGSRRRARPDRASRRSRCRGPGPVGRLPRASSSARPARRGGLGPARPVAARRRSAMRTPGA